MANVWFDNVTVKNAPSQHWGKENVIDLNKELNRRDTNIIVGKYAWYKALINFVRLNRMRLQLLYKYEVIIDVLKTY